MKLENLTCCLLCDDALLEIVDPVANISRCLSCGYVFDNPRPVSEEIVRFYSTPQKYHSWLAEERARDRVWKHRLRKMRTQRKPGTILDIGTGVGQFLHHAQASYKQVYGTEVSTSAISIAKDKYSLEIMRGDALEIQFRNPSTFDTITLFHVLEHVSDPKGLLERCWSLLTEDGILVVAVPNDLLSLRMKWLRLKIAVSKIRRSEVSWYQTENIGKLGFRKITLEDPEHEIHLSHFTPQVLQNLIAATGFTVLERSVDPINIATGVKFVLAQGYYYAMATLLAITHRNFYDTIWITAQKKLNSQSE